MNRAGFLSLALLLVPLTLVAQTSGPPDIILLGGRIFTNDPAKPAVQAVAIRGDRIIATGTDEEISALAAGNDKLVRIRLNGRVVIPGINDAHIHPGLGPVGIGIGSGPDTTVAQLSAALSAIVDETPSDLWIIAEVGRAIMLDESVNRAALDTLAPNRKVLVRSFTGHGTILSSAALAELGIQDNVPDPPGGRFGHNPDGTLNGRVFEYAEYPIHRRIAELTQLPGDLTNALIDFSNQAIGFGITSIQAMPLEADDVFRKAWDDSGSPIHLRHINFPLTVPPLFPPQRLPLFRKLNGLKWILDGTPIEKGAAVRTQYPDGGSGVLNFTTLAPLIKFGLEANQQLLFHAAGDQAVAMLLSALQSTPNINWPARRPRIEHGDGLLPDLDAQARNLGVIVVLNPTHFFARTLYPNAARFMRAKSLLDRGLTIAIGSDGPFNPYLNIMLAVDRPDNPREALTREEAVAAYTLGSALAEAQTDKGKIAKEHLADLAVLSQNIFEVPVSQLPDTRSLLTIIGGKIVLDELPQAEP